MCDSDDKSSVEDLKDLATAVFLSEIRKRRYYQRPRKYRKTPANERFATDLNADKVRVEEEDDEAVAVKVRCHC